LRWPGPPHPARCPKIDNADGLTGYHRLSIQR
jgi:hypothetical protein